MSFLDPLSSAVAALSGLLRPAFGDAATAAAIILCTLCVRLALHPLARAAVRGERVRAKVGPRVAELQKKHRDDPERMRRAVHELYAKEGASPVAGCLPTLLQLPFFFAMYHVFTTDDGLLRHTLLGAPLGGRWADALAEGGPFGAQGLVYLGLFAVVTAVAVWTYLRNRRLAREAREARPDASAQLPGGEAMTRLLPLLSFGTVITAAVVPLAAGLYLATTTAWTAVERAALGAGRPPVPESSGRRASAKAQVQ
ncbi:YidC/Oxa1 family membrane protein insertase [Streptomyces sp. HNM0574]|uniref:YidC/Oxa1 family membrane protein insertase n=1 Tax=Streptomyces sp. HNM0574 TaxID=2714954 RepID=UPI00146A9104|nr:YidC/Oxa1 family membrane protein insertase [Streptomyces sp. HNM0574]NLU66518.1 YidC/Oxa1 family membrane protein insertase [Streptomyces sp. HNM0574]